MSTLRCLLVCDGPTDFALRPIIEWTVSQCILFRPFEVRFLSPRDLPRHQGLAERIRLSLVDSHGCDLLFIHRDAEREAFAVRVDEIQRAVKECTEVVPPHVCVVPVRMTEAWLLMDESAIRRASGNPNGRVVLTFPDMKKIEDLPDPKKVLKNLLAIASELKGRRLKHFSTADAADRIPELITNFTPLLQLSAFSTFKDELSLICKRSGWK